jgi:hypothetical protein
VHIVNGETAMVLTGLRRTVSGHEESLTRGRIPLQSEGAEVFYRNIVVRRIRSIPRAILG